MDFEKLEKNITDVVKEQQLKLGYMSEVVRLYYPLSSLNCLLNVGNDCEEMYKSLELFNIYVEDRWGKLEYSNNKDRFCIKLPSKAGDYIHEHIEEEDFLVAFIRLIAKHGCKIEDIISLFKNYSDEVHFEKVDNGEFDYLIYFENGSPDNYRYCLTDEGCHLIYHRYTAEDYEDFGF